MADAILKVLLSIAATLTHVLVSGVLVAVFAIVRVWPPRPEELAGEGKGSGIVRDRADEKTLGIVTLKDFLGSLVGDVREAPRGRSQPC
ncbi:MAG: hypothetical protein ABSF89_15940 [Acidimicrobiales bacterium]|jgi:CBS domain containing-hemolysin-like protein